MTEATKEPEVLGEGQLAFALYLNPLNLEFSLEPINTAKSFIEKEADFLDKDTGEVVVISDETWALYANQVAEIVRLGKEASFESLAKSLLEALSTTLKE